MGCLSHAGQEESKSFQGHSRTNQANKLRGDRNASRQFGDAAVCLGGAEGCVTLTTTGALSGAQLGVRTVGISHAAS